MKQLHDHLLAMNKQSEETEEVCTAVLTTEHESEVWPLLCSQVIEGNKQDAIHKIARVLLEHDHLSWRQRIEWCQTPEEFQSLFQSIGIGNEQWRSSEWLSRKAKLAADEGGIGIQLAGLSCALRKRFGGHKEFVAWMDGMSEPERNFKEIVQFWKNPNDALLYFHSIGLDGDEWRNSGWLVKNAQLDTAAGGIGVSLSGLVQAIRKRFGGYRKFVAWMDGKEKVERSIYEIVNAWRNPEDADSYLRLIGLNDRQWNSSDWLSSKAKLEPKEGGIGSNLKPLARAIAKKFGRHKEFVAWMDGKSQADQTNLEIVESWQQPEDAESFFSEIGVPHEKWRSSWWLQKIAKLPLSSGGIEKNLLALSQKIRKRFGGHREFVAWVDGAILVDKIETVRQAQDIVHSECKRLELTTDEYLDPDPKSIKRNCLKSPALKAVLIFFRSNEQ